MSDEPAGGLGTRTAASALSTDADPARATGEVIGALVESLRPGPPDLAVLFVAGRMRAALPDIVDALRRTIQPTVLVGTTAAGVLAGGIEAESGDALAVWAGHVGPVEPVRLAAIGRSTVLGLPEIEPGSTLLLLADPATFPVDLLVEALPPEVTVVGGLASAGGDRLVADGDVLDEGAVGVVVPPGVATPFVSQGCRPIGQPFTVTRAERNLVHELGGRPAIERLESLLAGLGPDDRAAAARGLHLGIVADDRKEVFGQGDFLIRAVLGVEQSTRAVAVGDLVDVGRVVQFQVRDHTSASADLERTLSEIAPSDGALVFTCNGRGTHLFPQPHHDAARIDEAVDGGIAGMFCAGEIGPVGPVNALHGFTATALLFVAEPTAPGDGRGDPPPVG